LHNAFLVRINYLFKKVSKENNYFFLSGLLIGHEVRELLKVKKRIILAGSEKQLELYSIALSALNIKKVNYRNADNALIAGHCKLYKLNQSELQRIRRMKDVF
jgi:2-dehydro-3-deoxygalactonokinase